MTARAKAPDLPSERYINRELSWLKFNERVLEEARNEHHPLLERLRFLSISASNLDEFYMVRYAGLREQARAGIQKQSLEGRTPAEQVQEIETAVASLMSDQQSCWLALRDEMRGEQIEVLSITDLKRAEMTWLKDRFENQIFPILTPQAVDPAHPFPFIPNLGFAVAFQLSPQSGSGEPMVGLVPMPAFSSRFIRLPDKKSGELRFVRLESVIAHFQSMLFPGYEGHGHCVFRIIRDSDIEIEEEAEDLIANLEETATVPAVDPPDEFEPEFSEPSEDSTLHTQENTETPSTDPVETEQSPSKSDEEEPSSGAEMEKFNAFIPQIDTFKKWAFRFFGGTVIGNAFVWYAEAPIELRVLLGVLVLLIVAGVMVVFAKYHDKVFEYVLGMNLKKSGDPEVKPLDSASLSIKR